MKYNNKKKSKDKPKGRKVMNTHSIIIIKNEKKEYLQYYDKKWNCYLFLNSKMKNKEDMESIYNEIKEMLNIEKEDVEISFVSEKIHKKFSESDKIEKEYQHFFYKVNILKNNEKFSKKEFEYFNIKYKWFSFKEFENDERIQKVNSDIIQFVKSFNI